MALFETMTAISVSLAIAIPTFMDKVMRPKYEKRFTEFTKARREVFFDEFESAFNQLKQTKEEMTPELIETMEELFNEWSQVKTEVNKLTRLLRLRKFFFVGWLIVAFLCLLSIQYSDVLMAQTKDITFGNISWFFFGLMFIASLYYGYDLFTFDEKLSKIKAETTGEAFGEVEPAKGIIKTGLVAENMVEQTLKKFKIPFSKDVVVRTDERGQWVDFSIPPRKPKYIIEVKTRIFRSRIYSLSRSLGKIKSELGIKTILISNFRDTSPELLKMAKAYWDFVIDFQELEKLKEIIELES
jgi:hypothetical protein